MNKNEQQNQTPPGEPSPYQQEPVRIKVPDRKPVVTFVLIGITVVFYAVQFIVQTSVGYDLLFLLGGKINQAIMLGEIWRLITPALLHSSILHIALNMYALYIIGRRLERFYGHMRFLALYLLSAFAGNVLSFVLTPGASLGASTAIFGLLAAEGVFILQNRKLFGPARTRQMLINLGVILVINLSYGFMSGTNVDNLGHIGGLLGGVFFAWKAGPLLQVTGQAPFFRIVDVRKQAEILLAGLIVLVGFSIMAIIPFITQ
jgi:rhomboid protease GluP